MSGTLFRNVCESFAGPVYPVNPHAQEIRGRRVFPTLQNIPEQVDLALIAVPAPYVVDTIKECVAKGVKAVVVISAGFSESGEAGRHKQDELLELVRHARVPLVGPNCLGLLNTDPAAALNGTFGIAHPAAGNVAVCTQSGALGFVYPEYMRQWGLGISMLVSVGNKVDVGENSLLEYWEHDDSTRVIQLYLESFQDPRGLLEIARRVSRSKPIVALKAGRTAAGTRAAGSHTAALAGPDVAAQGLFRQGGIVRVETLEELCGTTAVLAAQPLPGGRRVAVLTNAGGPGVLCADALEAQGFTLPELPVDLQALLRRIVPAEAAVCNPIDLIGTTDPGQFRHCLRHLLATDLVDAVVVIYVPRLPGTSSQIAQVIRDCAETARSKTLVSVFMDLAGPPSEPGDASKQIPCFRYPEAAARALQGAAEYAEWRAKPPGIVPTYPELHSTAGSQAAKGAARRRKKQGTWLLPEEVYSLLESMGLPVPRWDVASAKNDAVILAQRIGFPVVLKAVSPTVIHKSARGGVVLDVRSPSELHAAYEQISRAVPDLTAVFMQEFVRSSREMMVGVRYDPAFGHLISFGLGGVHVEALRDVHCRLHPLTNRDAEELIRESPALRMLGGTPDRPTADLDALVDCVLRVSALVSTVPEIREADFNPVSILPNGQGIRVLDARLFVCGLAPDDRQATNVADRQCLHLKGASS